MKRKLKRKKGNAAMLDPLAFAEHLLEFGNHMLDVAGHVDLQIVAITKSGEVIPILVTGDCLSDEVKPQTMVNISALLKREHVVRYGVLAEGWFLLEQDGDVLSVRPSKSERRRECLHVSVCTEDGCEAIAMQEIDRDDAGKAIPGKVLTEPTLCTPDGHQGGGTFVELLQ